MPPRSEPVDAYPSPWALTQPDRFSQWWKHTAVGTAWSRTALRAEVASFVADMRSCTSLDELQAVFDTNRAQDALTALDEALPNEAFYLDRLWEAAQYWMASPDDTPNPFEQPDFALDPLLPTTEAD